MTFLLSRQAEKALNHLWEYYFERGGTRLADRILAEIRDAIDRLIEHPNLGHFRPDLTDKPLRFYRVYNLLIVYDPDARPSYIARVYHAAQDVKTRMTSAEEDH